MVGTELRSCTSLRPDASTRRCSDVWKALRGTSGLTSVCTVAGLFAASIRNWASRTVSSRITIWRMASMCRLHTAASLLLLDPSGNALEVQSFCNSAEEFSRCERGTLPAVAGR